MKTYVRIDGEGYLLEVIPPVVDGNGDEIPIELRFHPSFVSTLMESDPENLPPTRPVPGSPFNLQTALARARARRAPVLNALAGIGFDALAAGDTPIVEAVQSARQMLKNVLAQPDVLAATSDQQFDALVMAHYNAGAATMPAAVKTAFKELT